MTLLDDSDDDGLSGMWKARALRAQEAIGKLENYCFGLETQTRGFRPKSIRELFALNSPALRTTEGEAAALKSFLEKPFDGGSDNHGS